MAEAADAPAAARTWTAVYPPSVPRDPAIPAINLPRMFDDAVARFPYAIALDFEGARTTYAQLHTAIGHLATALSRLEVRPGDRVALVLPNSPQLVTGLYATMRIGAVAVPLNPASGADALRVDLAATDADVVICGADQCAAVIAAQDGSTARTILVTRLIDALPRGRRWRLAFGLRSGRRFRRELRGSLKTLPPQARWLSDVVKAAPEIAPRVDLDPSTTAVVLFSAGRSGEPRPIELTHRSLVAGAYQAAWWVPHARAGYETSLALLPMFDIYGLTLSLNTPLLLGARLVLVRSFDPAEVIGHFARSGITHFPAVPAVLRALVDRPELRPYRTSNLRATYAVGAALPDALWQGFERMTISTVSGGYGTSESGLTHAVPFLGPKPSGSIGVPLPLTDAKVVDLTASRRPVRPGTVGELLVRGPQVSGRVDADGFFATGDLVTMDEVGFTWFVGRVDDLIRVGRQRVNPVEVEAPVLALPDVARAAAVQGYSSTRAGIVKLYVEPRPGALLDIGMIREVCEKALPAGAVPGEIEIRGSLPLTGSGEVLRSALRAPVPGRTRKETPA